MYKTSTTYIYNHQDIISHSTPQNPKICLSVREKFVLGVLHCFFVSVTKIHMNYIETIYKREIYSYHSDSPLKRCKPVFPILIWPRNSRALRSFCANSQ